MPSLRLCVAAVSAAALVPALAAGPASAEDVTNQPLRPVLECVEQDSVESYVARFGYRSDNSVAVGAPVGANNRFTPSPEDRGQPTTFQPGRIVDAFQVPFGGGDLVWTLKNPNAAGGARTATASDAFSQRCVSIDLVETPAKTTTETTATFSWEALISGWPPNVPAWVFWRSPEQEPEDEHAPLCELDGVPVDCDEAPELQFTGLAPGEHTFTVTARAPKSCFIPLFLREQLDFESRIAIEDPGFEEEEPLPFPVICDDGTEWKSLAAREGWPGEIGTNDKVATASYTWTITEPAKQEEPKKEEPKQEQPAPQPQQQQPSTTPPVAVAAPNRSCGSRRTFTIRIRESRRNRIRSATVLVDGKRVAVRRRGGRLTASVRLATLPKGRFSVKITARMADGSRRSFTRRYRTCDQKLKPSNGLERPSAL